MFKLPGIPMHNSSKSELADYAEWLVWQDDGLSKTAFANVLERFGEVDYSKGVPEDDPIEQSIHEVYDELLMRERFCRGGYPFKLNQPGNVIFHSDNSEIIRHIVYKFLLLATRLDMKNESRHAGINGTSVFEELSAEVASNYLGDRSESLVFGARRDDPNFKIKIDNLCYRLREGGGFESKNINPRVRAKDGKLDFVAWKHFSDLREGKLIAFGQCKTGTSWDTQIVELQPKGFCDKWFKRSLTVTPVRMFFVSESLPADYWYDTSVDAGILFDRCRIIDYCDEISDEILDKIERWTEAASEAVK